MSRELDKMNLISAVQQLPNEDIELVQGYVEMIEQENEGLKKQLNELQKTQIFIDTQDIEEEYGEGLYQDYLEEEVKELKKQLEKLQNDYEKEKYIVDKQTRQLIDEYKNTNNQVKKIEKMQTQQQEFIKYLENCIKELEKESLNKLQNVLNLGICDITKEILSKYKEIIGVEND